MGREAPARRELHLEHLIDRPVYDRHGKRIGHLEEIRAVSRGSTWEVSEYPVGAFALLERLGAWPLGRGVLRALHLGRKGGGYRVPWRALDLADPARPTLRCEVSELETLEA
jgi:hypothetical protein